MNSLHDINHKVSCGTVSYLTHSMGRKSSWLIVEDALRNKRGHWAEYITTFYRGLLEIGDKVEVLCDSEADDWLVRELEAYPVLPPSIWHRMNENVGKFRRMVRIPVHALKTYFAVRRWLNKHPAPDVIFVPTVWVHHLLGWWFLMRGPLRNSKVRVLLFFPMAPILPGETSGEGILGPELTAKLFGWFIRHLNGLVAEKRIILGAETHTMRTTLSRIAGVPFLYLPHPVHLPAATVCISGDPVFAVYGAARFEKGSDVLQKAIREYFVRRPDSKVRFVIQWIDDFKDAEGRWVKKDADLLKNAQVEYITSYFKPGEYDERLAATSLLLLPYRKISYDFRVSRVVIEAMARGIPVIATDGTTLAQQASEFGACVSCEDGSVDSLVEAIERAEKGLVKLRELARQQMASAVNHFSVHNFKKCIQ